MLECSLQMSSSNTSPRRAVELLHRADSIFNDQLISIRQDQAFFYTKDGALAEMKLKEFINLSK